MRRLWSALVVLAVLAAPAAGQEADDLGRFLDSLTTLWLRGDASGLVRMGTGSGLDLEIHGEPVGPLSGRRAVAELRHMFNGRQTVAIRPGTPSRVVGSDDRAFVELTWEVRPRGAPVTESNVVFVGFVRERSGWKVSQIRILP